MWLLHDVKGVANLEVFIDGEFVADIAPYEYSASIGVSEGAHTLTVRTSGTSAPLLTQELSPLPLRSSLIVLQGESEELSLLEVSRALPEIEEGTHLIEVVDLSGVEANFKVLLSGQSDERFDECDGERDNLFTCVILSLPLSSAAQYSSPISVNAGSSLSLSTTHLEDLERVDLPEGEATMIVIRDPDQVSESLLLLNASL